MSEILDDLNISSLKINGGVNFGGKFVGSLQTDLEGGASSGTATAVLTTTLVTTLKLTTGTSYISLASGTVGQMKIIVVTSGTETRLRLNISDYVDPSNIYFDFSNLNDNLTLIYTAQGWVKISGNAIVWD